MSVVAVGSVAGSPGVSTLAVGIAAVWPGDRRVLLEADPDGGRLGAELGVVTEPGLVAAALAARSPGAHHDALIAAGAAEMRGGWRLIPGPPSPEQAWAVMSRSGTTLARVLSEAAADPDPDVGPGDGDVGWIVDCGRLSPRSPVLPIATAAHAVVLVSHGSFAALQLVPPRVSALASAGCEVSLAVTGTTPWPADEIASFVGCDVVAALPAVRVRRTARSMAGGEWAAWWSAVRRLAESLHAGATAPAPGEIAGVSGAGVR